MRVQAPARWMEMRKNGIAMEVQVRLRDMHPHLQRTPRSRSPRRCPWTPGACRPRNPRTRSPTKALLRTSRPRTPRSPSLRRSPCARLHTDSGKRASTSQPCVACAERKSPPRMLRHAHALRAGPSACSVRWRGMPVQMQASARRNRAGIGAELHARVASREMASRCGYRHQRDG